MERDPKFIIDIAVKYGFFGERRRKKRKGQEEAEAIDFSGGF